MATRNVEMIYENGILRPLEPLSLQEGQHITVPVPHQAEDDEFLASLYAELDKLDRIPTLDEVRQMTAGIKGSFADFIIAERGEY